ncbi:MAG: glycosyltransferase [Proteobacteria bacterium]|nr:glycosyltransferase [Pseudomonadota bacterium]
MPALRLLSNTSWFHGRLDQGRPIVTQSLSDGRPGGLLRDLAALRQADVVVVNVAPRQLLLAAAAKRSLPGVNPYLVAVDLILRRPLNLKARLRHPAIRSLLAAVDLFIFYFKETAELCALFGIPPERVCYVPFKVNDLEALRRTATGDEGYFLACGRSNRDYATLCQAVDGLPFRTVILAPLGPTALRHGTTFAPDSVRLPANVEAIHDDGSSASWLRWIANARAVVLPIERGMLSPSGIGTYLVAMALGKCVVITESPATRGLLNAKTAVIVPPVDPTALRRAIVRVATDDAYREAIAAAGQRYALALGDERRLAESIYREVLGRVGCRPRRC